MKRILRRQMRSICSLREEEDSEYHKTYTITLTCKEYREIPLGLFKKFIFLKKIAKECFFTVSPGKKMRNLRMNLAGFGLLNKSILIKL
jgi:hypothetical protein